MNFFCGNIGDVASDLFESHWQRDRLRLSGQLVEPFELLLGISDEQFAALGKQMPDSFEHAIDMNAHGLNRLAFVPI